MTPAEITRAIKTCAKETVIHDTTGERGTGVLLLVIRRYKQGVTCMWTAQWQQDGKRHKMQIGRYPDLSLVEARAEFQARVRDVLSAKKNPRVQVVNTERPTVTRLFNEYCDRMEADGKVSAKEVRRCLGFAAEKIGPARMASDIEPSDVSAYLGKLYAAGTPVAADRVRAYLSAAFNFGLKAAHDYRQEARQDWGIKMNPVAAVPKDTSASQPRDRALTRTEIGQLWHGFTADRFAPETVAAVRLLLCTGQRVLELLRVEAHEVDLADKVWRMPAEKTKTKQGPHEVPLPALAVTVFEQLIRVRKRGLLFGDMEHQVINRALTRWLSGQEMPHFQTRDLRRTWKSRAADAGVDRFTRDLIQQHAMGDTGSRHYDRADYGGQMREAMGKWQAWLSSAIELSHGRSGRSQQPDDGRPGVQVG
jgi:integrase